ncbi:hypothetical protein HELRODRAFT_175224 [Helobdella robusta]|uniref:PDZ domain-containing protein n=1 Tax=Helobdella robusta TaxID=6412 RepID=T1F914_HELRO|nr:hypothetical protein HELRODRAFT_175224 [Helobdella robusta]ESO01194.1 hypothetical protein HELRODRAFT_175224 [Helobdella robusta]
MATMLMKLERIPKYLEQKIYICKGTMPLGLSIEATPTSHGCVIKNISNGAVLRDGRLSINDVICDVNNETLRGVSNFQAKSILRRAALVGDVISLTSIPSSKLLPYMKKLNIDKSDDGVYDDVKTETIDACSLQCRKEMHLRDIKLVEMKASENPKLRYKIIKVVVNKNNKSTCNYCGMLQPGNIATPETSNTTSHPTNNTTNCTTNNTTNNIDISMSKSFLLVNNEHSTNGQSLIKSRSLNFTDNNYKKNLESPVNENLFNKKLGLQLAGNRFSSGVFVEKILPNGIAHLNGGFQVRDQIIQVKNQSLMTTNHLSSTPIIASLVNQSTDHVTFYLLRLESMDVDVNENDNNNNNNNSNNNNNKNNNNSYSNEKTQTDDNHIDINVDSRSNNVRNIINGVEYVNYSKTKNQKQRQFQKQQQLEQNQCLTVATTTTTIISSRSSVVTSATTTSATSLSSSKIFPQQTTSATTNPHSTSNRDDIKNANKFYNNNNTKSPNNITNNSSNINNNNNHNNFDDDSNVSTTIHQIEYDKPTWITVDKKDLCLGVEVVGGVTTLLRYLYIHDIFRGGAVHRDARLKIGDKILQINDKCLRHATDDYANDMLRRQTTSSVSFQVVRESRPISERDAYDIIQASISKKSSRGFGFCFVVRGKNEGVFVSDIIRGTSSDAESIMLPGDQILRANDVDMRSVTHHEASIIFKTALKQLNLTFARVKSASRSSDDDDDDEDDEERKLGEVNMVRCVLILAMITNQNGTIEEMQCQYRFGDEAIDSEFDWKTLIAVLYLYSTFDR